MILNKFKKAVSSNSESLQHAVSATFFRSDMFSFQECYHYLNTIHKDVRSSSLRSKPPNNEKPYKYDVSVIMTTYNRAHLVENCIESILSNVSKDSKYKVEYIFVNDGSKDNTQDVLEKYRHCPDVTLINQENGGLSKARNSGIDASSAKYLLFVDDDDLLIQGAVEKLLDVSQTGDYDIVEGTMITVSKDGTERKTKAAQVGEIQHPLGTLKGFAWGKLLRKTIFDRVIFPEKYWFEDSINSALIYGDHIKAYMIEDAVYKYFSTQGSITSSHNNPKNLDSLYISMQLLKDRKDLGLPFRQENYEYFLRMTDLTYQRTKKFDTKVKYCVFKVTRYLYEQYYIGFATEKTGYLHRIEEALLEDNFQKYVRACELAVLSKLL
ncbi:MAG: glycosyltransferase family 2 protein [Filifactor alocis]|nr:glycosyltransferase family 2 protein [Filifactor alocis]